MFRNAASKSPMTAGRVLRRAYAALVAVLCLGSVAYAMHANREAARAQSAASTAREWERIARATHAHRAETTASLALLVRRYNSLARKATIEQRRMLARLAAARRRAAHSKSAAAAPITYETTQSVAVAAPISVPAAPVASAAPVATSDPVTKTS